MPIMNTKPTTPPAAPTPIAEQALLNQNDVYKTSVTNTAVTAPDSLLAYMEGMAFPVAYFSQLVSEHDAVKELDIGNSPAYQQYRRINKLELRMQSSLSFGFSADTGTSTITGSAIIPFIVPNIHDYFIADAGIAETAIFRVTGYERKTYHTTTVYLIEFASEGFIRNNRPFYDGLIQRAVQSFQFVKDRVTQGLDPLLTENQHATSIELKSSCAQLAREYFARFVDPRQNLIRYPSGERYIYDTRFAEFIFSIVDSSLYSKLYELNHISPDTDPHLSRSSLFDALKSRDIRDLSYGLNRVLLLSRVNVSRNSMLRGMISWSVDFYVYPKINNADLITNGPDILQYPYEAEQLATGVDFTGPVEVNDNVACPWNFITYLGQPTKIIHAVHGDDYYIFSQAFYDNLPGLSLLEILMRDYLTQQEINLDALKQIVDSYQKWPLVEKFYYGPMVIMLIKTAVRGFY